VPGLNREAVITSAGLANILTSIRRLNRHGLGAASLHEDDGRHV
jgi:hypothetical protein